MAKESQTGLPRIKQRIDQSESARQHNAIRTSIMALHARGGGDALELPANHYPRPFEPYAVRYDSDEASWVVNIAPGYVIDSHVKNEAHNGSAPTDSAVKLRVPTITGDDPQNPGTDIEIDIDDDNPAFLALPDFTSFVYLRFETDNHGLIKTRDAPNDDKVVTVEAFAAEQDSVHHEPPNESGTGVDGDYYFLLFKTESNGLQGDSEAPVVVHQGFQSNLIWQEAFVVQNADGTGANVYWKFDPQDDEIWLRTINGRYGLDAAATDETINCDFRAENRSTSVTGTSGEVFIDSDNESVDGRAGFRVICQGPSGRQEITVNETGDVIQIYGNDFDDDLVAKGQGGLGNVTLLGVNDGMVSKRTDVNIRQYSVCTASGIETKNFLTTN